ncbi:MAG TPA: hypothetical protein VGC84_13300, partial [Ilumatobacteraceae bacterium]
MMRTVGLMTVATCCGLTACASDAPAATDGQYCAKVSANLDELNAPAIADAAGIASTAKLYRSIAEAAPLAVQNEWETMTSNVEVAATVDPADPASVQHVADMARSSQHAAAAIADFTTKVCGVTLAAVTTTLPPVAETA